MLTIQIKDWNNKTYAVINDIFSLQAEDEINRWWKLKIEVPVEKRMQEKPIKKWYRIVVNYWIKIAQTMKLFDWYITDITVKNNNIEIQAENRLSYLQYRIIRSNKSCSNKKINVLISEVFTQLNTIFALPISLWLNDCETKITNDFSKGTSFYDILKYCREAEKDLIVRVIDWVLEVSKNTGDILEWIWEYDSSNTRATNIWDWNLKDSMDNFYSYLMNDSWNISNSDFHSETKLMFEKYESDLALTLPTEEAIPSVSISRDTDWRDFNIWDRKHIRLNTGYERLPLEYLWIIQSRKITINGNWGLKAEIKVSEKYKQDTNILDLVLQNLRKK